MGRSKLFDTKTGQYRYLDQLSEAESAELQRNIQEKVLKAIGYQVVKKEPVAQSQ